MELRVHEHGPYVVIVTIDNQPRRNAMSRVMMAELAALWDRLDRGSCRAIVLTGAGERAFSSGADISGDLSADPEKARIVSRALLKHHPYSKPIIAAVNGDCVGGGVELLLSTDIRAAAPHARFGLPEVRWSIYPFGGATVKLVQQIGHVHAMELLLTAKLVDAAEAARIGLVNRVVPAEALEAETMALARRLAAGPAQAMALSKAAVEQVSNLGLDAGLRVEEAAKLQSLKSAEVREGIMAFVDKRNATFPAS